jgi:hypothetical protein
VSRDELPAEDLAALREAVLGFYEESVSPLVGHRRRRMARRLHRPGLRWLNALLLLPWLLVGLVRMVATGRASAVVARQQPGGQPVPPAQWQGRGEAGQGPAPGGRRAGQALRRPLRDRGRHSRPG